MSGRTTSRIARGIVLAVLALLLPSLPASQGTVLAQDGGSIASCLPGWSQGAAPSAERILRCVREASGSAVVVGGELADDPTGPTPCQPAAATPESTEPAPGPGAAGVAPGPVPGVGVAGAGAVAPAPSTAPATPSGTSTATFRLCGGESSETARAIERFVAGRGFSARARSFGDGCLDLTLTLAPPSLSRGTQSASLSVGTGRGQITVRLVSEDGQTRVSILDEPASGGRRDEG